MAILKKVTRDRRQTIYRERSGGRWEYWTYSDKQRVYLSYETARRIISQDGILITC